MNKFLLSSAALLAIACLAPAQLGGTYTIAKTGGTYASFKAAAVDIYLQGVKSGVTCMVSPGVYTESSSVYLLGFAGSGAAKPITFCNPVPNAVTITSPTGDTFIVVAPLKAMPLNNVTFDGIKFSTYRGCVFNVNKQYSENWEIKNCIFLPGSVGVGNKNSGGAFYFESGIYSSGWNIHHNKITAAANSSISSHAGVLYSVGNKNLNFHHNELDLNGGINAFSLWNSNSSQNRFTNNLIYGKTRAPSNAAIMYATWSQYGILWAHNTICVQQGASGQKLFHLSGGGGSATTPNTVGVYFYGNIMYWTGAGYAYSVRAGKSGQANFRGDRNIYWNPGYTAATLLVGNNGSSTNYTLTPWKTFVSLNTYLKGPQEVNSVVADPRIIKPVAPFIAATLDTFSSSIAKNLKGAFLASDGRWTTIAPVTQDWNGRYRDGVPDSGAFEKEGFAVFGTGCAGTGKIVPVMGYTGTIAMPGSFTCTLDKANGGASGILVVAQPAGLFSPALSIGGGCHIYTNPFITFPFVASGTGGGNGKASQVLVVPSMSALKGTSAWAQWVMSDMASPSPFKVAASNAGAINL